MSPLLRDKIEVFLAPKRIDLVHTPRGLKSIKRPVVTELISPSTERQVLWEQSLLHLDKLLPEKVETDISITLSNHFVRYVALLPQTEITTPEEVSAYADFRMREIYGARVDHWVISISAWNPVYGAISAAIPQELLARIKEVVEHHYSRLNNVEPYFTTVLDRWEKTFNQKQSFVALIETDRLCTGVLKEGIWQSIRNQRILKNAAEELWAALDQEAVLMGHKEADETVYLFAPEHPSLNLPPDCGWRIVPLQTDKIAVPGHYPKPFTGDTEGNACLA